MTTTQHVDEQTLITTAMHPHESNPHLDQCEECQGHLEVWRRIAEAARVSVASAPPPREDLAERMLASLEEARVESQSSTPIRRHVRSRTTHRTRWLALATFIALVVAVVAITLSIGSAGPSTASVLRKIRGAPSLIESSAKAVYVNAYSTIRQKDGYVLNNFRIDGVFNPRTNAFRIAITNRYPGQHSSTTTYSSDGKLVYLPCDPNFRLIGKLPCVAYPAQGNGISDWLALTYLREAHPPVIGLGERSSGSSETTGYGLTVPIDVESVGALPFWTLLGPSGINSSKNFRVDVWSDSKGLIHQLDITFRYKETSIAPPALLTITTHERVRYGESAPGLIVPNRQSVLVAPNESAAYQLRKSYADELGTCRTCPT